MEMESTLRVINKAQVKEQPGVVEGQTRAAGRGPAFPSGGCASRLPPQCGTHAELPGMRRSVLYVVAGRAPSDTTGKDRGRSVGSMPRDRGSQKEVGKTGCSCYPTATLEGPTMSSPSIADPSLHIELAGGRRCGVSLITLLVLVIGIGS